ncbi:protein adenylyltransferase FICD-like [Planococcus citri]|uniref:protein adenylyltransferase FICD-like n=1 Tax=Planococcus citri TaxID=170843 RepID=UPI0031F76A6C
MQRCIIFLHFTNSKLVTAINRIMREYFPKKITESQVPKKKSSSRKNSIFINRHIRIPCYQNECKPSISYHTPCKCVTKFIDSTADKLEDAENLPQNDYSVSKSLHDYAKQSLLIGKVSPTDENIEIIKNASLYADTINLEDFNLNHLLEIHRLVMAKNDQLAGKIRDQDVVIRLPKDKGSSLIKRIQTPLAHELHDCLEKYFQWFREKMKNSETNDLIFAAMAKYYFFTIHAFDDGNGITSRIILNAILRKFSPYWVTIPLAEIAKYYAVIGIAQNSNNYNPYLAYITNCIRRSSDIYIDEDRTRRNQMAAAGYFCCIHGR